MKNLNLNLSEHKTRKFMLTKVKFGHSFTVLR